MTVPPTADLAETGRLEAFSDGVFAVAITLLVLGLTVPSLDAAHQHHGLAAALLVEWPFFLAYALSFVNVLIVWVNHHSLFRVVRQTDHFFLLLNGFLLLIVCTLPFATLLLGTYLAGGIETDKKTAQIIYAALSLVLALCFNWMWSYAARRNRLLDPSTDAAVVRAITRQYRIGPPLYVVACAVAFVNAEVSVAICVLLALFFVVPSTVTH